MQRIVMWIQCPNQLISVFAWFGRFCHFHQRWCYISRWWRFSEMLLRLFPICCRHAVVWCRHHHAHHSVNSTEQMNDVWDWRGSIFRVVLSWLEHGQQFFSTDNFVAWRNVECAVSDWETTCPWDWVSGENILYGSKISLQWTWILKSSPLP